MKSGEQRKRRLRHQLHEAYPSYMVIVPYGSTSYDVSILDLILACCWVSCPYGADDYDRYHVRYNVQHELRLLPHTASYCCVHTMIANYIAVKRHKTLYGAAIRRDKSL